MKKRWLNSCLQLAMMIIYKTILEIDWLRKDYMDWSPDRDQLACSRILWNHVFIYSSLSTAWTTTTFLISIEQWGNLPDNMPVRRRRPYRFHQFQDLNLIEWEEGCCAIKFIYELTIQETIVLTVVHLNSNMGFSHLCSCNREECYVIAGDALSWPSPGQLWLTSIKKTY